MLKSLWTPEILDNSLVFGLYFDYSKSTGKNVVYNRFKDIVILIEEEPNEKHKIHRY